MRVSVRGRCTLEIICEMKKNLTDYHRQAIELIVMKLVLQYRGFVMQRELTTALVLAWVPQRKGFRWQVINLILSYFFTFFLEPFPYFSLE